MEKEHFAVESLGSQITDVALSQILSYIDMSIDKAVVTIDGEDHILPIEDTRTTNGVMRKYVYLDEDHLVGTVTHANLIDNTGSVWVASDFKVSRDTDGFVLVFPIQVRAQNTKKETID